MALGPRPISPAAARQRRAWYMLTQQPAGAAAPGPWTPASLPGMAEGRSGWWTYTAGLPAVGNPVDSWAASAGTLGALSSSGTSRPTMAAVGPHADGVDDFLEVTGIAPPLPVNDWVAWVIISPNQDLTGWYMATTAGPTPGLNVRRLSTFDQVRVIITGTAANDVTDVGATPVGTAVSLLVTRDSVVGIRAYIDGMEFLSDADPTDNAAGDALQIFMSGLTGWIGGTVHDVGFHDGVLTGADLTALQAHLEAIRTGV